MTRRLLLITLALLCVGSMTSCILNPIKDKRSEETKPTVQPMNLTENWHVLHNLELSYNDQDIAYYEELIDQANYIFYFAPDEPDGQWNFEADKGATANMFSGKESNNPRYGKINDINMELLYEGVQWSRVIEPGFENEIWEEAVVNYIYDFSVEPDWNLINGSDAKAVFTVRQVFDEADNRMEWRLVRWSDLGFL